LRYAFNSKILLDVPTAHHNGLSFRVFEAIGFGKKLITTNKEIKQYDFYHPNNIFVWDDHSQKMLGDFLDAPYLYLATHIKESYSFNNWIKALLREDRVERAAITPRVDLEPSLVY